MKIKSPNNIDSDEYTLLFCPLIECDPSPTSTYTLPVQDKKIYNLMKKNDLLVTSRKRFFCVCVCVCVCVSVCVFSHRTGLLI